MPLFEFFPPNPITAYDHKALFLIRLRDSSFMICPEALPVGISLMKNFFIFLGFLFFNKT